jgi:hypothetical protein
MCGTEMKLSLHLVYVKSARPAYCRILFGDLSSSESDKYSYRSESRLLQNGEDENQLIDGHLTVQWSLVR